jgi:hypothetical protein
MSYAAKWAVSAGNKFRQAARESTNPTTKLLTEGLTHRGASIYAIQKALVWGGVGIHVSSLRSLDVP